MALDVIMYHYVRDFKSSFYKNIKGLDVNEFENQIRYLKDNYTILNPFEAKEMILESYKFDKQYYNIGIIIPTITYRWNYFSVFCKI